MQMGVELPRPGSYTLPPPKTAFRDTLSDLKRITSDVATSLNDFNRFRWHSGQEVASHRTPRQLRGRTGQQRSHGGLPPGFSSYGSLGLPSIPAASSTARSATKERSQRSVSPHPFPAAVRTGFIRAFDAAAVMRSTIQNDEDNRHADAPWSVRESPRTVMTSHTAPAEIRPGMDRGRRLQPQSARSARDGVMLPKLFTPTPKAADDNASMRANHGGVPVGQAVAQLQRPHTLEDHVMHSLEGLRVPGDILTWRAREHDVEVWELPPGFEGKDNYDEIDHTRVLDSNSKRGHEDEVLLQDAEVYQTISVSAAAQQANRLCQPAHASRQHSQTPALQQQRSGRQSASVSPAPQLRGLTSQDLPLARGHRGRPVWRIASRASRTGQHWRQKGLGNYKADENDLLLDRAASVPPRIAEAHGGAEEDADDKPEKGLRVFQSSSVPPERLAERCELARSTCGLSSLMKRKSKTEQGDLGGFDAIDEQERRKRLSRFVRGTDMPSEESTRSASPNSQDSATEPEHLRTGSLDSGPVGLAMVPTPSSPKHLSPRSIRNKKFTRVAVTAKLIGRLQKESSERKKKPLAMMPVLSDPKTSMIPPSPAASANEKAVSIDISLPTAATRRKSKEMLNKQSSTTMLSAPAGGQTPRSTSKMVTPTQSKQKAGGPRRGSKGGEEQNASADGSLVAKGAGGVLSPKSPKMRKSLVDHVARNLTRSDSRADAAEAADCIRLSKKHRLAIEEVRWRLHEFHDLDKNGNELLSRDEFEEAIRRYLKMPAGMPLPPHLFDTHWLSVDFDSDDCVDFEEFLAWTVKTAYTEEVLVPNPEERNLRRIARANALCLYDVERIKTAFDEFDTNGNGSIDTEEFRSVLLKLLKVKNPGDISGQKLQRWWREIDVDGSGSITFEEFLLWYMKYFES